MPSIFLRNLNEKPVVVSFLFFEVLGAICEKDPDIEMGELIATGLVQTNQRTVQEIQSNPDIIAYAASRMDLTGKSVAEDQQKPHSRKRQYGGQFIHWFENLSAEEKCLFAADYDYDKARFLYCDIDRGDACEIIRAKFDLVFETGILDFEATVFGMGGSFGGSSGLGEVTDFSTPGMTEAQLDASAAAFMAGLGRG